MTTSQAEGHPGRRVGVPGRDVVVLPGRAGRQDDARDHHPGHRPRLARYLDRLHAGMVAADARDRGRRALGKHLPERVIAVGAAVLFFGFGAWLLADGWSAHPRSPSSRRCRRRSCSSGSVPPTFIAVGARAHRWSVHRLRRRLLINRDDPRQPASGRRRRRCPDLRRATCDGRRR